MALTYKQFYKTYGIRTMQQFISGKLSTLDLLKLPLFSTLHYLSYNDTITGPNDEHAVFNIGKKIPVYSVTKFQDTKGNVKPVNFNVNQELNSLNKQNKQFKIMRSTVISRLGSPSIPVVFNYNLLHKKLRYTLNPLNTYFKWYNITNAYIRNLDSNVSNDTRKQYVLIEVPNPVPKLASIIRHSKGIKLNTVKEFTDPNAFTILDICMWLNPSSRKDSVLGKLSQEQLLNTVYIFTSGMNWISINLGVFNNFNKDSEDGEGTTTIGYRPLTSMFLITLARLAGTGPVQEFIDTEIEEKSDKPVKLDELEELADDLLVHHEKEVFIESEVEEKVIDISPSENSKRKIQSLNDKGLMSNPEKKKMLAILEKQETAISPYKDGKLQDALIVSEEDIEFEQDGIHIPDNNMVLDKTMNSTSMNVIDKNYIEKVIKKDTLSTIYSLQNNGTLITDHSIENVKSVMGNIEIHKIKLKPLNGKSSVITIRLPVVDKEGVFQISSNRYTLRKQRADKPLRKLDYNIVGLTTYYGKLFVSKAFFKFNDTSFWIKTKILKEYSKDDTRITKLVTAEVIRPGWSVPSLYTTFSKYIKTFTLGNKKYYFDYNKRGSIWEGELKNIEKKGRVLIGTESNKYPIIIDNDNRIYVIKEDSEIELDHLYEQLSLDRSSMPIEYATIKIFSKRIPLVAILIYYMGINNVLKHMKTKYELLGSKEKVTTDSLVIKFKDSKLVIPKTDLEGVMMFGGLLSYKDSIKEYLFKDLQSDKTMIRIFTEKKIPSMYIKELDLMNDMFVDPISKEILLQMKEPTTFKGLLYRSAELLTTDEYLNSQDLSEMLIKGYERIPGMIYKQLVNASREFHNKNVFSTAKIELSPYAVWSDINSDSTTMVYDDLNPIAALKQYEDVTYLGAGMGRVKQSMVKKTRQYHESDIGVISEAVKDSGDVGISMYMSANPELSNVRGSRSKRNPENGTTSLMSTSSLLAPGSMNDD